MHIAWVDSPEEVDSMGGRWWAKCGLKVFTNGEMHAENNVDSSGGIAAKTLGQSSGVVLKNMRIFLKQGRKNSG